MSKMAFFLKREKKYFTNFYLCLHETTPSLFTSKPRKRYSTQMESPRWNHHAGNTTLESSKRHSYTNSFKATQHLVPIVLNPQSRQLHTCNITYQGWSDKCIVVSSRNSTTMNQHTETVRLF